MARSTLGAVVLTLGLPWVALCGGRGAGATSDRQASQAATPPPTTLSPSTPASPPPAVRVPPALMVKISDDRPSEPLAVAKVAVEVVITGFVAETTTTLTFRNDRDRVLEGELIFPLPEGATVSGYALDIGGEMVDGVVVERHEARIAFEKEVRKGIDPGLVEWVKGNNFRTRVWPIPARGRRTVRVRYVSDLVTQGAGEALDALYALPLRFRTPVDDVSIRVEVVKGPARPEVRAGAPANFAFEQWQERYVARSVLKGARLQEDLLIALPKVPRQNVVVEKGEDGLAYFVIDDFPAPPAVPPAPKPKHVAVFWDASLSRERADTKRELAILEGWLRRVGDVDLDVVAFRNVPEAPRAFAVRGGDATRVVAFLKDLACDGGTSLGSVQFRKGADYALLFSDGLATLGDEMPQVLEVPVYAMSGDSQANHALLAHLAQTSGGEYFNLQRLADEEVIRSLGTPAFSFLTAEYEPGQIADVSPSGRRPIHGRFTLTGRLKAPEATVTIRYGEGAASQSRTYRLRQADASAGTLVPHLWAQQRVMELSVFPEKHHDELLELGRRFGIVTPGASLLVLETLQQYVEHGIEPPRTLAALRAEYLRRVQERQVQEKKARADKIERVLAMWRGRVAWWEREFRYEPGFRYEEKRIGAVAGGVPGQVGGPARAAEPTRPAPAPPVSLPPSNETITVEAEAPAIQTTRAASSAIVEKKEGAKGVVSGAPTIVLMPWDPQTPYLKAMRQAGAAQAYATYLAQRREHRSSPAFYLDCADYLLRERQREVGIRVLTSVVDLGLEEPQLLRIAAHRLEQIGELDLAVDLFEQVLRLRPEEPQSLRDLALALGARGEARHRKLGKVDATVAEDDLRAIDLLNKVVLGEWDNRFPEVEVIALEEANRLIALLERAGVAPRSLPIDPRLRQVLHVDVRIVLTWDTDLTDMDLWVVEPSGEKCFYSHPLTTIGGMISKDFTGGYGPEEYLARRAQSGEFKIQANFYGSRSQTLTGPTTVQATVVTNFGRPNEERQALTLRLTEAKEVVDVGTIRFEGATKVTR